MNETPVAPNAGPWLFQGICPAEWGRPRAVFLETSAGHRVPCGPYARSADGAIEYAYGAVLEGDSQATLVIQDVNGERRIDVIGIGSREQTPDVDHAVRPARVVIAMATYRPDPDALRRQLDSIREQTFADWVCVIDDDGSGPQTATLLEEATAQDDRFFVRCNETNVGFYQNFERALLRVPEAAEFVALADQDDWWHPTKLAALVREFEHNVDASLVYHDLRVVDGTGKELSATFPPGRAAPRDDLDSLLMANVVTGCAAMVRRRVLDVALPFPPAVGVPFHDHWLGLCALATGEIRYLQTPQGDYYQHGGNTLGYRAGERRRAIRVGLSLLGVPALAVAANSRRMTRRRIYALLLNQSVDELLTRESFAVCLNARLDSGLSRVAARIKVPGPAHTRRLAWGLTTSRSGSAYRVVVARLLAGALLARTIRTTRLSRT